MHRNFHSQKSPQSAIKDDFISIFKRIYLEHYNFHLHQLELNRKPSKKE